MTSKKTIFIVHTKSNKHQRAFAEALERILDSSGIGVWKYGDWNWQRRERRHSRSRGSSINMQKVVRGRDDVFIQYKQIPDEAQVASMLATAWVVVVVDSPTARLTEGVQLELDHLRRIHRKVGIRPYVMSAVIGEGSRYLSKLTTWQTLEIPLFEAQPERQVVEKCAALTVLAWVLHLVGSLSDRRQSATILSLASEQNETIRTLRARAPVANADWNPHGGIWASHSSQRWKAHAPAVRAFMNLVSLAEPYSEAIRILYALCDRKFARAIGSSGASSELTDTS